MEVILFILVIILLFWISSLSSRIGALEIKLSKGFSGVKIPSLAEEKAPISPKDYSKLEEKKNVFAEKEAIIPKAEPSLVKPTTKPTEAADSNQSPLAWLTKFGVLAIALGVIFFFKFAIDQGWINEWMRIVFGFLVGGLFAVLGELWKNKYPKYSYAISGGGILILDFTIYAAFNFYHLLPQSLSLLMMVATSAMAVWFSVERKSLSLAALGIAGAYGAPLLLSTGESQQWLLFSYLIILNVAVLVVLLKRFWVELSLLALLGTMIDYSVWSANYSTISNTWSSVSFLAISAVIFVLALAVAFRLHTKDVDWTEVKDKNFGLFTGLVGGFYFLATWFLLREHFRVYLPLVMLLGAVIWWVSYVLVDRLNKQTTNYALSFAGTWLVVFSAYWQFTGRTFDAVLIAIALVSAILGYFVKRREFFTWGLAALYISLFTVVFESYGPQDTQFLLNGKFALMLLETAAMVFVGWLSSKTDLGEEKAGGLSEAIAAILLWLALAFDLNHSYKGLAFSQGLGLWWVLYPPVLAFLALLGKRKTLTAIALIMVFIGAFQVLFIPYDPAVYLFLFNAKFGLMLLSTLSFLAVAYMQPEEQLKPGDAGWTDSLKVAASLNLWFALSWEIVQFYSRSNSGNERNLLLSVCWVIYATLLIASSRIKGFAVYRKVALMFFGLVIAKVFLYDVGALDIGYRVVSFIVLGVILLSVSFAYQKNKEKITEFLSGDKEKLM